MKYLIFSILILGVVSGCENKTTSANNNSTTKKETKKKPLSPHETAMTLVGDVHLHIDYSSPGVRGRSIFGDLIPFGKLWRAGANDATSIETNKDLIINDQILPAGKYGFFVIPNQEKWTLIFNTRWDVHGTDKYNKKEDVLRIEVIPTALEKSQEHLKYDVEKHDDSNGIISLVWEKTKVEFPFQVK